MGWFRKREPKRVNPDVLKAAASLFLAHGTEKGVSRTVQSWTVILRSELLSRGYDAEAVEGAIAHLLSDMEWR